MAAIVAVAGAGTVLLGAAPASAAPGTGTFTGTEIPPATVVFTNPATLCAQFVASPTDPLTQTLQLTGSFQGATGTGTATFTGTTPHYANPVGTYSDPNCAVPG